MNLFFSPLFIVAVILTSLKTTCNQDLVDEIKDQSSYKIVILNERFRQNAVYYLEESNFPKSSSQCARDIDIVIAIFLRTPQFQNWASNNLSMS